MPPVSVCSTHARRSRSRRFFFRTFSISQSCRHARCRSQRAQQRWRAPSNLAMVPGCFGTIARRCVYKCVYKYAVIEKIFLKTKVYDE